MVEWVKKASFDRLNKLFEIIAIERHHQTFLSARNLLVVVREPQPYVLNILPRWLPKVVVHGEHFVLKDLPFYEKASEADVKARQERLDKREEKRHEGTLRKVSDEKGHSSSPAVRPQAKKKKKKTIAQALKIVSPVPNLSSSSTDSAYNRSDGLAQASEDNSSSPWLDTVNPGTGPSQPRSEFIGLRVVNEPEEEEDMNDLRTRFLERHRKRLHEAIDIVPPPAKRACLENNQEDPARGSSIDRAPLRRSGS